MNLRRRHQQIGSLRLEQTRGLMDDFGIKPDVFVKSADTIMMPPASAPGGRAKRSGRFVSRKTAAG